MTQRHKAVNGQTGKAAQLETPSLEGAPRGRALRRLMRAEAAFERSQRKAAHLRVKLAQAEAKMARRAARIAAARTSLVAPAAEVTVSVPAAVESVSPPASPVDAVDAKDEPEPTP